LALAAKAGFERSVFDFTSTSLRAATATRCAAAYVRGSSMRSACVRHRTERLLYSVEPTRPDLSA
jgi:hypothetical protein